MMKKIIIGSFLAAISFYCNAQQSTEFGYNIGTSNYLGDMQPKDRTYKWSGFSTGIFAKRNLHPMVAIKGFVNYARICGDDSRTSVQDQLNRNLNFRSFVLEWGVVGELNLLPFNRFIEQGDIRHYNFTPFIYGGLNVFHFNPKTYYNGQWIALQPLSTEGQNTSINADPNYRLTQLALPFGFGFKYQVTPELTIAYEMGARKTFTDYLDDVSGNYTDLSVLASEKGSLAAELSYRGDEIFGKELTSSYLGEQRGNSSNKDWYLINSLSISYKLYKRY